MVFLRPATKLRQGYVFTHVCDSVHRGFGIPTCIAGGIPACLTAGLKGGGIPACLAAGLQGGGIPACLAGFQAHTRGGGSWGVWPAGGGSPGPHPMGYPNMHWGRPPPNGYCCGTVRILLECILVFVRHFHSKITIWRNYHEEFQRVISVISYH